MNSSTSPEADLKPRRWVTWVSIVLIVLFIAAIVAWMFVKSFVADTIQTQLADLNLGETKIGGISVGTGGVAAHDIEFKLQPEDEAPWLTVGTLNINHPITELAAGATEFNEIELDDAQGTLTVDQLMKLASTGDPNADFDLSELKLPAKKISVTNSNFQIKSDATPNAKSLNVVGANLQIQQKNDKQIISGEIEELLGGRWKIEGNIDPAANTYAANVSTTDLKLVNEQWQSLPYVPENLRETITASGTFDISTDITGNAENPLAVDGKAKVKSLDLNLPSFNLPITVSNADLAFDLDQVTASNLSATVDGQDQLSGTATAKISSFPLTVDFDTQFKQMSIETLRRIVPDIPEILVARANGNAKGNLNVAEDLRMTIGINADAVTESASYGDLQAASSNTTVVIESLVFDENQAYESITGTVGVDAEAAKQPLNNVFSTFELEDLSKQLDLEGDITGQARLDLPLATIEDLKTWGLSINGKLPEGKLAGQTIRNGDVVGGFDKGVLVISPLTATAVTSDDQSQPLNQPTNQLRASLAWPLVAGEADNTAAVSLSADKLPAPWIVGLAQNQIQKATGEPLAAPSSELSQRLDELEGEVNFDVTLKIPVEQPDDILKLTANGNVRDSRLVVEQQSLSNLSTNIQLAGGKLTLSDLGGQFPQGGFLAGDVTVDLSEAAQHNAKVEAKKVPLLWLITVAKSASADFATQFNQAAGLAAGEKVNAETVAGELDLKVDFSTLPPNSPTPWTAELNVESEELRLLGESFRKLNVEANSDSKKLIVEQLKTNIGDRGFIEGNFDWDLQQSSGDGNLDWESLSIETIARLANTEGLPITGLTNGKLALTSVNADGQNPAPEPDTLPINIKGEIAAVDLTAAKVRVKPFKVDIATRSGVLFIENFKTENESIDVDLIVQADLKAPYKFEANGSLGRLQLSRLLKQSSVTQKEGEVADVSGIMFGKFQLSGQATPFDFRTNGKLQIKRPFYNNKPYGDVVLDWDHVGNDFKKSKLSLKAFGGEVKLVELTQQPQRVRLNLENIDAVELTSLFDLPIELTGTLEGNASLNDWDITETRNAEVELKGSSLLVSEIKIGDFTANANYREEKLTYGVNGALLGGKFEGKGDTEVGGKRLEEIEFPITFTLNNALLANLNRKSPMFRSLRALDGNVSATAEFLLGLDRPFEGDGRIGIGDAKWSNELITRSASIHFNLAEGRVIFNDVKADLKRGTIKANATIPYGSNLAGTYECDIRQMDIARIAAIASDEPLEVAGTFDARINGQIGRIITGQGYVGVDQASLQGVNGQSVRLPIEFVVSPTSGSGRLELRRSTFRIFDGTASGVAKVTFGSRLAIDTDLKLTRINTGKMLRSLADFEQGDQGELNGRLKIKGSGIRSARDLKGTFEGQLSRTSAFQLPVLSDLGTAIAGNSLQRDDFSSEDILLQLDNGRLEVKNMNFTSSLANVAITGFVFVDGRLDLGVAARVERFNQPTLLEELAGSPLAAIRGTPTSFFLQAADFLSDRVVFLKVGGTVNRPNVRVDTRQQLREETIRYFLRGSQVLP